MALTPTNPSRGSTRQLEGAEGGAVSSPGGFRGPRAAAGLPGAPSVTSSGQREGCAREPQSREPAGCLLSGSQRPALARGRRLTGQAGQTERGDGESGCRGSDPGVLPAGRCSKPSSSRETMFYKKEAPRPGRPLRRPGHIGGAPCWGWGAPVVPGVSHPSLPLASREVVCRRGAVRPCRPGGPGLCPASFEEPSRRARTGGGARGAPAPARGVKGCHSLSGVGVCGAQISWEVLNGSQRSQGTGT